MPRLRSRAASAALIGVLVAIAGCSNSSTSGPDSNASPSSTTSTTPASAGWTDYNPAALYPATTTLNNQFITMADGVKLAASVTLPADAGGKAIAGRFPVVLTQTGYNKDVGAYQPALGGANDYLVRHGYAHVVVDTRGTGRSEGQWTAFGETEQADYTPTVDWAATQPWSDGRVGLYGASLLAITALLTAAQQHPAIKAAFPIVPMADSYRDIVFTGGQVNAGFIPLWLALVTGLSVLDLSFYQDPAETAQAELQHISGALLGFQVPVLLKSVAGDPDQVYDGPFWRVRSPVEFAPKVQVPTFIVGGLHDIFQRGEPLLYQTLKDHVQAKLLIGPWTHIQAALGAGLPADGVPVLDHIALQWFDQYVKGMDSGAAALPTVTQYVYGHEHYVTASDWPHPQLQPQRWYLHSDRSLSTQMPDAGAAPLRILQEPLNGLCSESTAQWTAGLLVGLDEHGCFVNDNLASALEVKYDTAPLTEDLYLNGPIAAHVFVSTTAMDAGVIVRVDDVAPNGRAFALTNGLLTASFRAVDQDRSLLLGGENLRPWHPYTQASRQRPGAGTVVELPIEIFPTAALIKAGHRLRISVGASDFPHGLPPLPSLVQQLAGVLSIHSDAAQASYVALPVVPNSALQP